MANYVIQIIVLLNLNTSLLISMALNLRYLGYNNLGQEKIEEKIIITKIYYCENVKNKKKIID